MVEERAGIIKAPAEDLRELVIAVLQAYEVPAADARVTADHLVQASLRGVESHGFVRLKGYVERIKAGGNNPRPEMRVVKETSISAVVEGDNSLGQVGGKWAMGLALKKARADGIGMVAMRNSNHYGMAAYYSMMAVAEGMIGFSATNVLACMAPTGGVEARIGNDPISVALPAEEEPAVVLDIATSKSSWGKALVCLNKNEPLPADCFQDAQGRPTLDAAAFLDGGTLLPIAEHKGYGMSLCISLLCGLLADGAFDTELPHLYKKLGEPGANSFLMGAVQVDLFIPASHFKERMDSIIRLVRSTRCGKGVSRVYLPGEIEHETEQQRKKDGIPLNKELAEELIAVAEQAHLERSLYSFLR